MYCLRADPNGLVRPLTLPNSQLHPRLVVHVLCSLEDRGCVNSVDDSQSRDCNIQKAKNKSTLCVLAGTQFQVKRLKCVKYGLDKISSLVDILPLRDLLEILSPVPSEGVHTTRGYSGLGILFENPLKSHKHCLPRVYHYCSEKLLILGNQGLCRFLPATLGCYSLRSQ